VRTEEDFLRRLFLMSLVGILAAGAPIRAAEFNVPGSHATIGAALAGAQPGDRVLVAAGTYPEHGLVMPEGVVLTGTGATPDAVVIDGQGAGRILTCGNFSRTSEIRNLTFTGGRADGTTVYDGSGGAILINHAEMTIIDCVFTGNAAAQNGGAVWIFEAAPTISGCVFKDNTAFAGGGGVGCTLFSSPSLQNCRFENNRADWGAGLSCRDNSSPVILSSVFVGNVTAGSHGYGGGAFCDLDSEPVFFACTFSGNEARYGGALANFADSGASLVRCTVVANRALWRGAGLYSSNATPVIKNSIFAFQEGPGLFSGGTYGPLVFRSNMFGNTGGDWIGSAAPQAIDPTNFSRDPLFCVNTGPGSVTFNLQDTSPCHPDSNNGVTVGAWPAGCGTPLPSTLMLEANWSGNLARLTWRLPAGMGLDPSFRLTGARAAAPEQTWEIPFTDDGDGQYSAADPTATLQGEGPFAFRLYAAFSGGAWTLMAQTTLAFEPDLPGVSQVLAAPNPFNPATSISFKLGRAQRVRIQVYDLDGRLVARLADREFPTGTNAVIWPGTADNGRALASGTYLILVDSPGRQVTSKVTLLK
jgi:hypothetical protein